MKVYYLAPRQAAQNPTDQGIANGSADAAGHVLHEAVGGGLGLAGGACGGSAFDFFRGLLLIGFGARLCLLLQFFVGRVAVNRLFILAKDRGIGDQGSCVLPG